MDKHNVNSLTRIIQIYEHLRLNGEINLLELVNRYGKDVETIKKDIRFIREALGPDASIIEYDRATKVYKIDNNKDQFFHCFILLTILYGARSLKKEELHQLSKAILGLLSDSERIQIKKITDSYDVSYIPMIDNKLFGCFQDLYDCIQHHKVMNITYTNSKQVTKTFPIAPLSITYDEGFFYVFAYNKIASDQPLLRNYRVDRIQGYVKTKEKFTKPLHGNNFFEAGKHSNQSFMMHSGDSVVNVTLMVEPWLSPYLKSKFPLHNYLRKEADKEVFQVEVAHEDSVIFWLLQQRTWAEVLKPERLREKLKQTIIDMAKMYEII